MEVINSFITAKVYVAYASQKEKLENSVVTDPETTAIVNVDVLRLRSGPSTDYDILDRLMFGTILQVIGSDNEWIQVMTADGKKGWVHGDFVVIKGNVVGKTIKTMHRDIEERIKKCKIMRVFNMSFEEVLNILGEPDENTWISGDVYIWNDASKLIGNNEDGHTLCTKRTANRWHIN